MIMINHDHHHCLWYPLSLTRNCLLLPGNHHNQINRSNWNYNLQLNPKPSHLILPSSDFPFLFTPPDHKACPDGPRSPILRRRGRCVLLCEPSRKLKQGLFIDGEKNHNLSNGGCWTDWNVHQIHQREQKFFENQYIASRKPPPSQNVGCITLQYITKVVSI